MGGIISSKKKSDDKSASKNGAGNRVEYGQMTKLPPHAAGNYFVLEEKQLGKGAYATVKVGVRAEDVAAGPKDGDRTSLEVEDGLCGAVAWNSVAVKCIDTLTLKLRDRKALSDETRIMRGLNHPHIVKMYADIHGADGMYYLVMERVRGGELFDRIVELESYTEVQARATAVILLDALHYLHSRNICHRDLKPENLLLKSKDTDSDIKIADFGFAAEVEGDECLTDMCGTPNYVAPEVIKMGNAHLGGSAAPYGLACDMWSVGVIIFVLLGGYPPFEHDDQKVLFQLIAHGIYEFHDEYWAEISDGAKDLISKLLMVDPKKRITAAQALKHPWLELNEAELNKRSLNKNLAEMRRWNQKRKLKRVYNVVMASVRMKLLIEGIKKGAKKCEEEEEDAAAPKTEEEMREAFSEFDKDGDGTVTRGELGTVMQNLGQSATEEQLEEMVKDVDTDNDGTISFDEFKAMMQKMADANTAASMQEKPGGKVEVDEGGDGAEEKSAFQVD